MKYDVAQGKKKLSSKESADLQEKRNALSNRIQQWRDVQLAYMPTVAPLLLQRLSQTTPDGESSFIHELAEHMPLFFPSSLPVPLRDATQAIAVKELRLRKAQAEEALEDVRRG